MRFLLFKIFHVKHWESLKEFLQSDGYRISEILASKDAIPKNIENFDAIFLLGGPMSVNDNFEYIKKEKQLVVNSINLGIPILGICLGSQIIVELLWRKSIQWIKKRNWLGVS